MIFDGGVGLGSLGSDVGSEGWARAGERGLGGPGWRTGAAKWVPSPTAGALPSACSAA